MLRQELLGVYINPDEIEKEIQIAATSYLPVHFLTRS